MSRNRGGAVLASLPRGCGPERVSWRATAFSASLLLEVFCKKSQHRLIGTHSILAPEAVTGAFQGQQLCLDIRCLEPVHDPHCLFVGHVIVFRAVNA